MALTIEQIVDQSNVETEEYTVEAWGGAVVLRGISKRKQRELRQRATDPRTDQTDGDELEKLIFLEGMFDPKVTEEQYEQLIDSSAGIIDGIISKIMQLSKMNEEAVKLAEKSFPVR